MSLCVCRYVENLKCQACDHFSLSHLSSGSCTVAPLQTDTRPSGAPPLSASRNLRRRTWRITRFSFSAARWVFFPQRCHLRGWWGLRRPRRAWDRVHLQAALSSAARGRSHDKWQEVTSVGNENIISQSPSERLKSGQERHDRLCFVSCVSLCKEIIRTICKNAHHKILI